VEGWRIRARAGAHFLHIQTIFAVFQAIFIDCIQIIISVANIAIERGMCLINSESDWR